MINVTEPFAPIRDKSGVIGLAEIYCNEEAVDLRDLFVETIDRNAVSLVGPFERVFYSKHRDPKIRGLYKNASSSLWPILGPASGMDVSDIQDKLPNYAVISIPVREYYNDIDRPLWELTDIEDEWPVVWALNLDRVPDPSLIKKGSLLQIPAKIVDWVPVDLDTAKEDKSDLARKLLGGEEFAPMVERFISLEPLQSQRGVVFLPEIERNSIVGAGKLGSFVKT
jgi:hypothetical protein